MLPLAMKLNWTNRGCIVAFVFLVSLVTCMCDASAQSPGRGAFATTAFRGRSPLSVSYTLDLSQTMTMAKVNVVVSNLAGPSKADRNLVVVFYVKDWGGSSCVAYRKALKLPEAATTAQVDILFPCTQSQFSWDLEIFEEGRNIEDRRNNNQADYQWSYANQALNLIPIASLQASTLDDAAQTETSKIFEEFSLAQYKKANVNNQQPAMPSGVMFNSPITMVDGASTDWRDYLPYPTWLMTPEAIREINTAHPNVAEALRTFVSAGGMLAVYDAQSPEVIEALNELLGCRDAGASHWQSYTPAEFNDWLDTKSLDMTAIRTQLPSKPKADSKAVDVKQLAELLDKRNMLLRPFARGSVLITGKPLQDALEVFDEVLVNPYNSRQTGTLYQLTSAARDENWFWQNLILEVGKPPVLVFCIMVTLCGAVLGPGLLYFTGRMQRRSLMIFLVPIISFLATLGIVLYGVLHEGFETYVRVHSVTAYDVPAKIAFGWSRQNYFSGLPPREGLTFPIDAYVRPARTDESYYRGDRDPRRGIDGTVNLGEAQTWNGWLKPRQHQQLLVGHRVDPTTVPISTEPSSSGGLLLKNLTATTLPFVALRGAKDDYYITTDLEPNKSIELQPQDRDSVAVIVGRVGADFKPVVPPELATGSDSLMDFGRSRGSRINYQTQSDIIGEALRTYITDKIELTPYSFVTLVPEFDAIAIPLKGTQSDNVNLAIGVQPW